MPIKNLETSLQIKVPVMKDYSDTKHGTQFTELYKAIRKTLKWETHSYNNGKVQIKCYRKFCQIQQIAQVTQFFKIKWKLKWHAPTAINFMYNRWRNIIKSHNINALLRVHIYKPYLATATWKKNNFTNRILQRTRSQK